MRVSLWIGIIVLALGIVLSYLADALIDTVTSGVLQTTAVLVAAILFVIFSAAMLGTGAGLVIHWIIGFATHWKAFAAEIILSFAIFFVGIGATIMSGNVWTGVQVFFTFFIASITLLALSFNNLFGGVSSSFTKGVAYVKSKFTKPKRGGKWKKRGTLYVS
ncbi:MAG: hypothetical protein QW165_04230 [Candidatus Woesearchaeota archaeon]